MTPNELATSSPLIIFDGTCVLCSSWVEFALRHGARDHFRFGTAQSRAGRALLIANGVQADNPSTFLFLDAGRAYTESDAVIRMLWAFGGAWRAAGLARIFPKAIRDAVYRWFGRRKYCFVPSAEDRDRFLL